ncbi:malonyl-CoA decarboxylase [Thalassococcus lentus]|uniref:Malonyl-CoA decarboxylase n=1 Tax=Thalassococcus lentus TaxID=1210524 RepID=A0ABT4XTM2_9RHOB|nr:malonyl-CoA decarboxylase [Thalassococcus lentus]MDA7425304.1 malonyl-CoA decarboxylase [Thalassococcus lentus]
MRRNWVFSDLLPRIFERSGNVARHTDRRSMEELCQALLSEEGEVSGYALAATLLDRYRTADEQTRLGFFKYMNTHLDVDADRVADLAKIYADDPSPEAFRLLCEVSEPGRQELLRRLNQPVGATRDLVEMRVDLLRFVKDHPELARTDFDFVHLLKSWFNRGFLVLEQITWATPARILDKIVAYEAVHQISDLEDLRRRLAPSDRRCFAFFHPSMPEEPLIFVELALMNGIPDSIEDLLADDRPAIAPETADTAAFYSISNCQKGLAGISFGNLLIKQVVAELSMQLPGLQTFVTLSPIPRLSDWLHQQEQDPELGPVARDALDGRVSDDTVGRLAARYLLSAKRSDGLPFDPVARFHLGNGAEIHDIHSHADLSEKGKQQSLSTMVNYKYDLAATEQNHEDFVLNGKIAATKTVKAMALGSLDSTQKGKVA